MPRSAIPKETLKEILVKSRRRCCMCFGLNRDANIKSGQVAHLDHNNSNNNEDNLAFLCFDHHDEYDSRTSQRKGFSPVEVKHFRDELHREVDKAFSVEVHFGTVSLPPEDPFAGHYIRVSDEDDAAAEIVVTPVPDGLDDFPKYAVTGVAYWGLTREFGPNIGTLSFLGVLEEGVIEHVEPHHPQGPYVVRCSFFQRRLMIEEENCLGVHGMNVSFDGEYVRA